MLFRSTLFRSDIDLDFVAKVTLAEVYAYLAFLSRDKAKYTRARSEEYGLNRMSSLKSSKYHDPVMQIMPLSVAKCLLCKTQWTQAEVVALMLLFMPAQPT